MIILGKIKLKLTGLVTSCVWTSYQNTFLKELYKRRKKDQEDVSNY
jgi:hypothetical protein